MSKIFRKLYYLLLHIVINKHNLFKFHNQKLNTLYILLKTY